MLRVDFADEGTRDLQEGVRVLEMCRVPGIGDHFDAGVREFARERLRNLAESLVFSADDEARRSVDFGEACMQRGLCSGPHAAE